MPGPPLFLGRELVIFAAAESAFGTAAQGYPQAAEAIRAIDGNVEAINPFEMRPDKFGTSTAIGKIDQHRDGKFEVSLLALPAGVSTEPDITDILAKGGWQVSKPSVALVTTVTAAGSTTSVVNLASIANILPGHFISFQMTAGGAQEVRLVTAASAGAVTVSPPLTAVPTNGYAAKSCIAYKPKDARADTPDSLTLFIGDNRTLDILRGACPESITLECGGDTAARVNIQGRARRVDRLVSTLINGAINDAVTSVVVDNGTAAPSDLTTWWQIDSEIVSVSATSGTTWTIARGALGSTPASHSDNAEIFPYVPTGTYAGSPVPATAGDCFTGTVPTALQIQSARAEFGFGISAVEDEMGDAQKIAAYACAQRDVRATVTGAGRYDTWGKLITDGNQRTATILHVQQGDTAGGIVGFTVPTARLQAPRIARGGTSEYVEVELAAQVEGTSAGEDECYLFFA